MKIALKILGGQKNQNNGNFVNPHQEGKNSPLRMPLKIAQDFG